MAEYRPQSQSSAASSILSKRTSSTLFSTPKTARKFEDLSDLLIGTSNIPNFEEKLEKLTRGAIQQAHLQQLSGELKSIKDKQLQRTQRARSSRQRLQTSGVVFSRDLDRTAKIMKKCDEIKERARFKRIYEGKVMSELLEYCVAKNIILKKPRRSRRRRETFQHPIIE